jgi:hypothetical protein
MPGTNAIFHRAYLVRWPRKAVGERWSSDMGEVVCDTPNVDKLPEYVVISPMAIVCPTCEAKSRQVCDVLIGDGVVTEVIHVERIKAAAVDRRAIRNK